jgi:hypothetical protein
MSQALSTTPVLVVASGYEEMPKSLSASALPKAIDPGVGTKGLIFSTFAYQIIFDYFPSGLRLLVGTALGGAWVVWSVWHASKKRIRTIAPYWAAHLMLFCCFIQQFELGAWQGSWQAFARYVTWILAMPGLLSLNFRPIVGLIHKMALAIVALSTFNAVTKGYVLIDSMYRRGTFTGGEEAAHPSGLTMAAAVLVLFAVWNSKRTALNLAPLLLSLILLVEIHVSTAQLLGLVPIAWIFAFAKFRETSTYRRAATLSGQARATLISLTALTSIIVLHELATNKTGAVTSAGNGRLGTWIERLTLFQARNFITKLIGTGPYSDIQISSIWWWSAKNAHNDAITFLMEFGFIGLIIYFLIISSLWSSYRNKSRGLALSFVVASFSSNAFLNRPVITILALLAFGVVNELNKDSSLRNSVEQSQI